MSRRRKIAIGLSMVVAYFLQLSLFPELKILGVQPDLMLVIAIIVAIQDGPVEGCIVGFIGGLAFDLTGSQIVGVGAFSKAATAFIAGVFKDLFVTYTVLLPFVLAFFAGLLEQLLYHGGLTVLGSEMVAPLNAKYLFTVAFYDSLVILVFFPIIKKFRGSELGTQLGTLRTGV